MSGQPGKNVSVRYKVESVFGTPVTGASGEEFRIQEGSPGLVMTREQILDPEARDDGMSSQFRHGAERVEGSYRGTLSVGSFNTLIAALFRTTFTASATALTCDAGAAHTSLAVTNQNTLTLVGTGSFITAGIRVGDVIRLGATAANDSINAVVATCAANVITVLGTPWANFTADTNASVTLCKHITNSTTLTRSSYTFEEYMTDLDESEQYAGCRVVSMRLTFQPNSVATVEFGIVGRSLAILGTSSAPGLTSPTEYTSIGLVAVDAGIYLAGSSIATITGGELMFEIGGETVAVVGSRLSPNVYEGNMQITGNLTAVRTALTSSHLARFIAETDNVELSLMFLEPDAAAPIDFFHVFLPRIKYAGTQKDGLGNNGPLTESIPIRAAIKATATGYDSSMASIATSV